MCAMPACPQEVQLVDKGVSGGIIRGQGEGADESEEVMSRGCTTQGGFCVWRLADSDEGEEDDNNNEIKELVPHSLEEVAMLHVNALGMYAN